MITTRHCFACDLKDNPELIERYKAYHAPGNAWPEITKSIKDAGIVDMLIYLTGNRMFMLMNGNDSCGIFNKRCPGPKMVKSGYRWKRFFSWYSAKNLN